MYSISPIRKALLERNTKGIAEYKNISEKSYTLEFIVRIMGETSNAFKNTHVTYSYTYSKDSCLYILADMVEVKSTIRLTAFVSSESDINAHIQNGVLNLSTDELSDYLLASVHISGLTVADVIKTELDEYFIESKGD